LPGSKKITLIINVMQLVLDWLHTHTNKFNNPITGYPQPVTAAKYKKPVIIRHAAWADEK
jgi:hypothetical protein